MANRILTNIQNQLNQLAGACPQISDSPAWAALQQEVDHLAWHTRRQELLLETAAAIANTASSVFGLEELTRTAVTLIQSYFDFYGVAIFLVDQPAPQAERGEWAELRARAAGHAAHFGSEVAESTRYRVKIDENTPVGWAIYHQKAFMLNNGADLAHTTHLGLPEVRSGIILPLVNRGQAIGALAVYSGRPAFFSPEDAVLMQTLTDQLTDVIQNAYLFDQADQKMEQLVTLHNINLQLGGYHDLAGLLSNVAQLSTALLGADASIIRLTSEVEGPDGQAVYHRTESEVGLPVTNQAIVTRQAVLANDWPQHPLNPAGSDTPVLAILSVPLVLKNAAIGAIELHSTSRRQAFDENDIYVLSLLAAQTAGAIANIRLFGEVQNSRHFLKTIIEHIPDPIFIKDRQHRLLEMNQANAAVIGVDERELIGKTDQDFFSAEIADRFCERDNQIFETNQVIVAEDKTVWGDGQEHVAYTRLIPMAGPSGRPEYLLGITHDVTESRLAEAERERLLAETGALYEGSRSIARALSERQIFDALFEQLRSQDPCVISAYRFAMVEGEPTWAELRSSWRKGRGLVAGAGHRGNPRLFLPETVEARLITLNEPLFIGDVAADERLTPAEREVLSGQGFCSAAVLPLLSTGQALGSILIGFTRPYSFDPGTRRFWLAMIEQAGIALANRQLIQEAAYRAVQMDTAAEVARAASSSLEMQDMLNSAVELICDRFDFYYVGVFLVDPAREWAVLQAGSGEAGKRQLAKGHRLEIGGNSMIGWCVANRQPRIALDVGKEAVRFQNPDLPETRSEMALPLIYRGEIIGALTVQSQEQAAFSREDIVFLQTMADQLANAIENARLYQAERGRHREAEAEISKRRRSEQIQASIHRISTEAASSTESLVDLFRSIHEIVGQLMPAENFFIALYDEQSGLLSYPYMVDQYDAQPAPHLLGEGLTEYVLRTGQPLLIKDYRAEADKLEESGIHANGPDCVDWLGVPLRAQERTFGVLAIQTYDKTFGLGDEEKNILTFVSTQVAMAIERKRADEALAAERNLLRTLVDNVPDYIYVKDVESRFVFNNLAHAHALGANSPEEILGKTDLDIFPEELARRYYDDEQALLRSGKALFNREEPVINQTTGERLWAVSTKVPLYDAEGRVKGLVGITRDITQRRQAEEDLHIALAKTQTLNRVGNILATGTDLKTVFETVLEGYLQLLHLPQGIVLRLDPLTNSSRVEALIHDGEFRPAGASFPLTEDALMRYLIDHPAPLLVEDVHQHPLTKDNSFITPTVQAALLIPLLMRGRLIGVISAATVDQGYTFSGSDIEVGQAIASQLSIWLENRQLLAETQYRSTRLQTAAEVSRAASSILDVNKLINTSVNLIRDQFNFYYVGLFLLDDAREFAVLRAGTGEAGQRQLAKGHRLEIGGNSMIGWSVANRKARIALDVGQEAVRFNNPDLPDTHSEMALPLVSRDEVIGALTVQSVERGAFSDEDITLLQTMADQLANVIQNARLFQSVTLAQHTAENLLQETQALQQLSQLLAGTLQLDEVLDIFFQSCSRDIGLEYLMLSLVDKTERRVKAVRGIGVSENNLKRANKSLDSNDIMADVLRNGQTEIITGWDERFDRELWETEGHGAWIRIFTPITLRQEHIGLVEAGFNKNTRTTISDSDVRLLRAFIDQTALALDNAQRYEASQRAARREALIKEITTRVRASTDLETILRTTVKEVGEAMGGRRTYVHLKPGDNGDSQ